jgi:hypothetical protein
LDERKNEHAYDPDRRSQEAVLDQILPRFVEHKPSDEASTRHSVY